MRHPCALRPWLVGITLAALTWPVSAQVSADPLDGTEWELFAFRRTMPIPDTRFSIRFEEGRVAGNAGCNGFLGRYEVRGDSIAVRDIGVEKMMCHEPAGLMEQEGYLVRFLSDARTFRFVGDQLRLMRSDHEALTFVPRGRE